MLIILSAALLPLGLIALFASLESARTNRLMRETEVRMVAADGARQLSAFISQTSYALRNTLDPSTGDDGSCGRAIELIDPARRNRMSLGLFDAQRRRLCASAGFTGAPRLPLSRTTTRVDLSAPPAVLRLAVPLSGGATAVVELPPRAVIALVESRERPETYGLRLRQGNRIVELGALPGPVGPFTQRLSATSPVLSGQLMIETSVSAAPIGAVEALMILLPILMWMAAAIIGWIVVERLLLRPLAQMQRAITAYGVHAGPLVIPAMTTPAHELRDLGQAFAAVTEQLTAHEAELESGLARQTKLTREVHHRVKNNLQVVSSLINLHARGVRNPEVGAAYASIQRRVDALAVVHRNHFAELEENRGVGFRPLLVELASNLRATAPPAAAHMAITLDIVPLFGTQDVAVPVAFLVTEIVELVMICDPRGGVALRLAPSDRPGRAVLSLSSPGLTAEACRSHALLDRFDRVITGLARQLRSPLLRDAEGGSYAVEISVLDGKSMV